MKWKWYWTPGWLPRLVLTVGLLVGAAFVEGVLSIVMIVVGLILLFHGYLLTGINIRKKQKELEELEPKKESDKEWAERELKPFLKEKSERDS